MHVCDDSDGSQLKRVVLPKCRRLNVLKLAHDKTAHIGSKGMRKLIGHRFTWPGLYVDIVDYVRSCESCLRMNQSVHKKSKMVERGIVPEGADKGGIAATGLIHFQLVEPGRQVQGRPARVWTNKFNDLGQRR